MADINKISTEQLFLGYLENQSGCSAELAIPPPDDCPFYVQAAHKISDMHGLAILSALVMFIVMSLAPATI